jgi:uncharacterized protein (TIGR02996 family)
MTEDEAFIRAIVDNRGDETSRLVYADWLDDRDDPRGPYLRAEAEWARTGKKEKALRELAKALDPVWVARVSRPPVGICADKIAMRTNRAPATPADLDAVEKQLKLKLPTEFRALLLNWNGARPALTRPADSPQFPYGLTEIEQFLPVLAVGKKRRTDYDEMWDLVEATETLCDPDFMPHDESDIHLMADYIPLADGGDLGIYLMGVRGKVTGKVGFFFDPTHSMGDPDHLGIVYPSLGALFASIIEEAPEWYRMARNGETQALLAWIDAGGDVNARHGDNDERPLSLAISAENLSLVRELLARGAKVDREMRDMAGWQTSAAGKKIRDALRAAKPVAKKKPAPKKGKKK